MSRGRRYVMLYGGLSLVCLSAAAVAGVALDTPSADANARDEGGVRVARPEGALTLPGSVQQSVDPTSIEVLGTLDGAIGFSAVALDGQRCVSVADESDTSVVATTCAGEDEIRREGLVVSMPNGDKTRGVVLLPSGASVLAQMGEDVQRTRSATLFRTDRAALTVEGASFTAIRVR